MPDVAVVDVPADRNIDDLQGGGDGVFGRELHGAAPSVSAGIDTILTRSSQGTRTCAAGSGYLPCLRRRSVNAMAATMATSRITTASSNG